MHPSLSPAHLGLELLRGQRGSLVPALWHHWEPLAHAWPAGYNREHPRDHHMVKDFVYFTNVYVCRAAWSCLHGAGLGPHILTHLLQTKPLSNLELAPAPSPGSSVSPTSSTSAKTLHTHTGNSGPLPHLGPSASGDTSQDPSTWLTLESLSLGRGQHYQRMGGHTWLWDRGL